MNPQDAIANLQNLVKAALKAGMFSEVEAVYAMQASIDTLKKIVAGHEAALGQIRVSKPDNGVIKERELSQNDIK